MWPICIDLVPLYTFIEGGKSQSFSSAYTTLFHFTSIGGFANKYACARNSAVNATTLLNAGTHVRSRRWLRETSAIRVHPIGGFERVVAPTLALDQQAYNYVVPCNHLL